MESRHNRCLATRTMLPTNERGTLRAAGLAGIAGAAILLASFVVFAAAILLFLGGPREPPGPDVLLPFVHANRVVFAAFSTMVVAALLVLPLLFLGLHDAVRGSVIGRAGALLGIAAVLVHAAGVIVGSSAQSEAARSYVAAGAEERRIIAVTLEPLMGGVVEALYTTVPASFLALGFLALGTAMRGQPAFPRGYAWLTLALGGFGLVMLLLGKADPHLLELTLILWSFVLGLRLFRLSRAPLG